MADTFKIKHTNVARDRKRMSTIVQAFAKAMIQKVGTVNNLNLDDATDEALLASRKELVKAIKKGMLERENEEVKIGVFAALVWFRRLAKEEQDRITGLW